VREAAVVALDRHHRLPRLHLVALVERLHLEGAPVVGAELEDGDRLVDAAQHRVLLLEDLHHHMGMLVLPFEQLLGEIEVRVRVITGADAIDRKAEYFRS